LVIRELTGQKGVPNPDRKPLIPQDVHRTNAVSAEQTLERLAESIASLARGLRVHLAPELFRPRAGLTQPKVIVARLTRHRY